MRTPEILDRRHRRIPRHAHIIHDILLALRHLPRRGERGHIGLVQREREIIDGKSGCELRPDADGLLTALEDGLPGGCGHKKSVV